MSAPGLSARAPVCTHTQIHMHTHGYVHTQMKREIGTGTGRTDEHKGLEHVLSH